MIALHTSMRGDRQARSTYLVVILVCLALLALMTFIQVAHVHSVATDADHCPLCIVLHTAAPVTAAVAVVVLVRIESLLPFVLVRPIGTSWHRQLFIRPPPCSSPAAF